MEDYSNMKTRRLAGLDWGTWSISGAESKWWDMDRVYNYDNKLAVIRRPSTGSWYISDCPDVPPGKYIGPYEAFRDAIVAAATMVRLNQIPFKSGVQE